MKKDLIFVPRHPEPGDTVIIVTRIHNYSLKDLYENVSIQYFLVAHVCVVAACFLLVVLLLQPTSIQTKCREQGPVVFFSWFFRPPIVLFFSGGP